MTRKSRKTAAAPVAHPALNSRTALLAGLGALSLGRRQAGAAFDAAIAEAGQLPVRGAEAAVAARRSFEQAAVAARARLAPVRRQAEAFLHDAEREFQAVAKPVLVRFGLESKPARKPAARKTAVRKTPVRKPAARKRAASRA